MSFWTKHDGKLFLLGGSGGLVQSGSNENGSWWITPPGLLVCTHSIPGSAFTDGEAVWTFPHPFASFPIVEGNSITSMPRFPTFLNRSTTSVTVHGHTIDGNASNLTVNVTAYGPAPE